MDNEPGSIRRAEPAARGASQRRGPSQRVFFGSALRRLSVACLWLACADADHTQLFPGAGGPVNADTDNDTAAILPYSDPLSAPDAPTTSLDSFLGANTCGGCHTQHYEEWSMSNHSRSMEDPVYRALVAKQREEIGTRKDRFCTQCHSPIGNRSGDIQPGFDFDSLAEVTQQGVNCETCHRTADVERIHNAGLVLGDIIRGPIESPMAPHQAEFSPLFDDAKLCGSCHDVHDPSGVVLERPYQAWLDSPAGEQGDNCQSCHMPTYRGTAAILPNLPERELHRHRFVGVAPPLVSDVLNDPERKAELWQQSEALLTGAASLELSATRQESALHVVVGVRNEVLGHDFPTGSDFNRQVWLELRVTEIATGAVLFQSGHRDPLGDLYDELSGSSSQDPQLVSLSSRLLNQAGEATPFTWETVAIERRSLEPGEARDYDYEVELAEATGPLRVEARLLFRSFRPQLLRELNLQQLVGELRIIPVAEASTEAQPAP